MQVRRGADTPRFGEGLVRDLLGALRQLRRAPGFVLLAALTIAVGLGANSAVMSLARGLLFPPSPFRDVERLASVRAKIGGLENVVLFTPISAALAQSWRELPEVEDIGGFERKELVLPFETEAEKITGLAVTDGFLELLGVRVLCGRGFVADDDPSQVIVLGQRLFDRLLAGDCERIGETIRTTVGERVVVGAIGEEVQLQNRQLDFLQPLRGGEFSTGVLRLAGGVSLAAAQARLEARRVEHVPAINGLGRGAEAGTVLVSLRQRGDAGARSEIFLLMLTAFLILAIGCANLTNVFWNRCEDRRCEIAVRRALGAGPTRVVSMLMWECLLVCGLGAGMALLVAVGIYKFLLRRVVTTASGVPPFSLDGFTGLGLMALALVAAAVIGAMPIFQVVRSDLRSDLAGLGSGRSVNRLRLRYVMVTLQIGLALVLATNASFALSNLFVQLERDKVVQTDGRVVASLSLLRGQGSRAAAASALRHELRERLSLLPHVVQVVSSDAIPHVGTGVELISLSDRSDSAVENSGEAIGDVNLDAMIQVATMDGDLLRTLGAPMELGRGFSDEDRDTDRVVVNRDLAQKHFPGRNPIGRWLTSGSISYEVIGVVDLPSDYGAPVAYRYVRNLPASAEAGEATELAFLLHTTGDVGDLVRAVRATVASVDPQIAINRLEPYAETFARIYAPYRIKALLHTSVSSIALFLSFLGVYGTMTLTVLRRTREIGVRMALGATRRDVMGRLLLIGIRLALAGLVLGVALTTVAARLLNALVPVWLSQDRIGFLSFGEVLGLAEMGAAKTMVVALPLMIVGAVLLACSIPAYRASRLEPMTALREE